MASKKDPKTAKPKKEPPPPPEATVKVVPHEGDPSESRVTLPKVRGGAKVSDLLALLNVSAADKDITVDGKAATDKSKVKANSVVTLTERGQSS